MLIFQPPIPFEDEEETQDVDTVILMEVTKSSVAFAEIYWKVIPGKTEIADINENRLSIDELKELVPCQAEVWLSEKEPLLLKIKILEEVDREGSRPKMKIRESKSGQ